MVGLVLMTVGGATVHGQAAPASGNETSASVNAEAVNVAEDEAEVQDEGTDPPPWYERIRFSGDLRSRYEGFYRTDSVTRNRMRLRLRLRLDTDINDDTRFQLQVASGDPGTPVSTNQTFTGFFTPKPFNLDRAFIAYNPQAASAMTLGLGKFTFPQTRTQMVFDDDLNYEGGWEQVAWSLADGIDINLVALQTAVNELSREGDSAMFAGYGEVSFALGEHRLHVSVADYGWKNVDPIARAAVDLLLRSILTNELVRDDDGNVIGFASRFNVVDVITEATFQTGRPNYPLRLLAEFTRNTRAANDRDSGFWLEAEVGRAREVGTWAAAYTYGWIEQDVTLSPFVFSDIPGTNLRLHMTNTSYMVLPGLSFDTTVHFTKRLYREDPVAPNNWLTRVHIAAVVRF